MQFVEIAHNRWRFVRDETPPARSEFPCPHIISDIMDPVEQVDGKFYTSKRQFRAVGRALGLTEVGDQKPPQTTRSTNKRAVKEARRKALQTAVEKYKAGHRPGGQRA